MTFSTREPYSPEAREFFRQWTEARARHRPAECHYAPEDCWVAEGPPAASGDNCCCKACGGVPTPKPRGVT
jgi:hypothetical protein